MKRPRTAVVPAMKARSTCQLVGLTRERVLNEFSLPKRASLAPDGAAPLAGVAKGGRVIHPHTHPRHRPPARPAPTGRLTVLVSTLARMRRTKARTAKRRG